MKNIERGIKVMSSKELRQFILELDEAREKAETELTFRNAETLEDIVLENDEIKVVLTYIGEGYSGDYNPNDPEDEPLFRFDVYIKDGTGEEEIVESRCTCLTTDISKEAAKVALEILFNEFSTAYADDNCCSLSNLADTLSHMNRDSVEKAMERRVA